MSVTVTCQCKTTFELKDDFAGTMVKCPKCGTTNRAPGDKLTPKSQADPVFDRDVFLLRQKTLAISEKYAVNAESGEQILYVVRPRHFFRNLMAAFAGLIAGTLVAVILGAITFWLSDAKMETLAVIMGILTAVGGLAALFIVGVGLSRKRHVSFYRGTEKGGGDKVLEVLQAKKVEFLTTTFVINDAQGKPLGLLRKNQLSNLLRKKWRLTTTGGRDILVAHEDSMILALLRRFLGPLFGLLRTNFVFEDASQKRVGEFNRKLTILDRYVLDMRADTARNVDRRLALAMGVILDTGERR
jgi:hypothetical protein